MAPESEEGLSLAVEAAHSMDLDAAIESPPPDVIFDSKGDLTLIVGEEKKRFKVCSRALARHSPVFSKMLFGNWAESRTTGNNAKLWEVDLPDDDPDSATKALHMVHGDFQEACSFNLSVWDLFKLLIFTNYYDMTAVVRPWSTQWFNGIKDSKDLNVVFIAWELGALKDWTQKTRDLAYECRLDDHGQLVIIDESGKMTALNAYEHLVPPHFTRSSLPTIFPTASL
jgi:hypothetical protein